MNEKAQNMLSGAEGTVFFDGEEMMYVESIEANIEKTKVTKKLVGSRKTYNKAVGWAGTGTLTVTKTTSKFREMMLNYIKNGIDFYGDLQITNQDPSATDIGKEVNVIAGVNFDTVNVGKLNGDDEILNEEMAFTFEDWDLANKFDL